MKKLLQKIMVLMLIITTIVAFCACEPPVEEGDKTITIMIIKSDDTADIYEEKTNAKYLGEAIDEMLEEEDIEFETGDSQYGRFVKKIDDLEPNVKQWINIHSDEIDPNLVGEDYAITYKDKTYKLTRLGIDQMPIKDGKTYVFSLGGNE